MSGKSNQFKHDESKTAYFCGPSNYYNPSIEMLKIKTPTLIVDKQKAIANLKRMKERAFKAGAELRPHFKTHQSGVVGGWFREAGITKITVSSVSMAAYFAHHGFTDITIAFPFNRLEMDELKALMHKVKINLVVSSLNTLENIHQSVEKEIDIYLKIDVGTHRSGIDITEKEVIKDFFYQSKKLSKIKMVGFLVHAGHAYQAKGADEIQSIADECFRALSDLKNLFPEQQLLTSWGDTPSCSTAEMTAYFDEWRPGNFIFYDVMQYHIGSCTMHDIAVAVACPVVEVHTTRNQLVIYGGAVHLSKDFIAADNGFKLFGYVVRFTATGWSEPLPGAWLASISQEHGVVQLTTEQLKDFRAGDIIGILPIHSCLAVSALRDMKDLNNHAIPCMK